MKSINLTLGFYLKKIENDSNQLDHHSFTQRVIGLARQVEPLNRQRFLPAVERRFETNGIYQGWFLLGLALRKRLEG